MTKQHRSLFRAALASLLALCFAQTTHAAPVTQPSGLSFGDPYRLVFVTNAIRTATSTNIADYNTFVSNAANAVPELSALGTTWKAIGSTATVDAKDNTGTDNNVAVGVPIYNTGGELIATNNADLWDGSIANGIAYDENGNTLVSGVDNRVWTGTGIAGTRVFGAELGASFDVTQRGSAIAVGNDWIDTGFSDPSDNFSRHLYAMSGELSAVPLPPAAALLGLPVLMVMRRRRATAA